MVIRASSVTGIMSVTNSDTMYGVTSVKTPLSLNSLPYLMTKFCVFNMPLITQKPGMIQLHAQYRCQIYLRPHYRSLYHRLHNYTKSITKSHASVAETSGLQRNRSLVKVSKALHPLGLIPRCEKINVRTRIRHLD